MPQPAHRPPRVLWHVSLRRAAAAFVVAALWVAIVAAAEISVTDFFQVRTFAEEVYTQAALGTFDFVAPAGDDEISTALCPPAGLWIGLAICRHSLARRRDRRRRQSYSPTSPSAIHRPPWIWRLGTLALARRDRAVAASCSWSPAFRWAISFTRRECW